MYSVVEHKAVLCGVHHVARKTCKYTCKTHVRTRLTRSRGTRASYQRQVKYSRVCAERSFILRINLFAAFPLPDESVLAAREIFNITTGRRLTRFGVGTRGMSSGNGNLEV